MYSILIPALSLPIVAVLAVGMRKRSPSLEEGATSDPLVEYAPLPSRKERLIAIFWELDLAGLLLLVGGVGLALVSITLANSGSTDWSSGRYLASFRSEEISMLTWR